jgi:hypothetical protein
MISEKGMPAPKPQNAGCGIKIVLGQSRKGWKTARIKVILL